MTSRQDSRTWGRSTARLLGDPHTRLLFLRFGAVGLLNTAFGYAVFALLILAGAWPGAARVAATIAGMVFNFQTSRRLVFGSAGRGRALRFVGVYGGTLALNWIALRALLGLGLGELPAQAMLVLPMAALSFLAQKLFVFSPTPERT